MNTDTSEAIVSEYLGISEAAEYLRVSASTLRRWEKKGFLIPERTPTGIRRYTKKQLDDVIQAPPEHDYSDQFSSSVSNPAHFTTQPHTQHEEAVQFEQDLHYPADEVDALKDFFRKAGYDTVEELDTTEERDSLATSEPVSEEKTETTLGDNSFQPISIEDITKEYISPESAVAAKTVPADDLLHAQVHTIKEEPPTLHPNIANIAIPEIPPMPIFESPSIPPKISPTPIPDPSEAYHEEHSNSFLAYMRKDREQLKTQNDFIVSTPSNSETETATRTSSLPAHVSQVEKERMNVEKTKSRIPLIIVSVVALVVVVFIGWSLYSYLSVPAELYNAVIE